MKADKKKDLEKRITENVVVDERINQIDNSALATAGTISMVMNLGLMVYGLICDEMKIGIIALAQFLIMFFTVMIIRRKKGIIDNPITFGEKNVSLAITKEGKKSRLKYSLIDASVMTVIFAVFEIFVSKNTDFPDVLVSLVIDFVIFFLFDYFILKSNAKIYNKQIAELDEDEDSVEAE